MVRLEPCVPVTVCRAMARMQRWVSSSAVVDRGLVGLGIAIAVGSAAFATGMILPGRSAPPPSVQARALDAAADRAAKDTEAPTESLDDDRTASMVETDGDAGIAHAQQARLLPQDRHDTSDPPGHVVSGYVLRYADVRAALVQGPGGTLVVLPGSVVPDAGLIRSIEKRAGRWVVVTATGTIEGPRM